MGTGPLVLPSHKVGQGQHRTTIYALFVVPASAVLHTKTKGKFGL